MNFLLSTRHGLSHCARDVPQFFSSAFLPAVFFMLSLLLSVGAQAQSFFSFFSSLLEHFSELVCVCELAYV